MCEVSNMLDRDRKHHLSVKKLETCFKICTILSLPYILIFVEYFELTVTYFRVKVKMAKLYSDLFKTTNDEVSLQSVCGISLADQFGIHLIPGTKIKPDGNCFISMVMDQIVKRFCLKDSIM